MTLSYTAPGSVIISGEEGILYGKPVLSCAINLTIKATLTIFASKQKNESIASIANHIRKYLVKNSIIYTDKPYSITFDSQLPQQEHLGYISAYTCVVIACLLDFYMGKEPEKELVNNLAYSYIKKYNKHFNGIATTASCFGGLIYFRKEFEFLKNISVLKAKIPLAIEKNLYVSLKPVSSSHTIKDLYKQHYQKAEELLINSEKLTKRLVVACLKEDYSFFETNFQERKALGFVTPLIFSKKKYTSKSLTSFKQNFTGLQKI